jgi:hypothetical protein
MSRRGAKPPIRQRQRQEEAEGEAQGMYERCPVCGATLDWDHPYLPNSAELDEIVPVSRLPEELRRRACLDPDNVQVLCRARRRPLHAPCARQAVPGTELRLHDLPPAVPGKGDNAL